MLKRVYYDDSTQRWVAEFNCESGLIYRHFWQDDPDYPDREGSRSGEEKANDDVNGDGGCGCG